MNVCIDYSPSDGYYEFKLQCVVCHLALHHLYNFVRFSTTPPHSLGGGRRKKGVKREGLVFICYPFRKILFINVKGISVSVFVCLFCYVIYFRTLIDATLANINTIFFYCLSCICYKFAYVQPLLLYNNRCMKKNTFLFIVLSTCCFPPEMKEKQMAYFMKNE